ncbi:hypothetical protein [Planococcus sp. CAU13]|uniref:hypothetical protein n=1 Tax=Planococcus sp. CAU13 TaxID=1541197 RepID=UPI0009DEA677|nr:hypothetical protein [Planococcus sp. CAU13]
MKFFIDHLRKSIHFQRFAGDSCGFISTPVAYREFTNCPVYVKRLITEQDYSKCTHCVTAPTRLTKKSYS